MTLSRLRPGALLVGLAWIVAASPVTGQAEIGEGARVYARPCGRCHAARSPLERSDREWAAIVLHMRIRANLTGS